MRGPCLCGDTECPWCGPLQGGPDMSDMYDDDEFCHIPDPETPQNCDHCGKVLPRFYRDIICAECDQSLRELKLSRDFRYPYADRG